MMLRAPLGWLNTPFYVKRISFVRASQLSLAAQYFFFENFFELEFGSWLETSAARGEGTD